ncbi:hypothetical protein Tco_1239639, partial [Tanacetum coccineum]
KDISIKDLKNQLEEALKEKDDLRLKLENFEESSKNLTKLINSQISAKDKTGLGYDGQMNESEVNNIQMNESEMVHSVFTSRERDVDDNPVNDRFKIGEGFILYLSLKSSAPLIQEWESDSEDENVFRPKSNQTKPKFTKINFVKSGENVKLVNKENTHRQAEYHRKSQSPRKKPVLNKKERVTGQREIRPVWNSAQRVNHQNFSNNLTHPHPRRNFVPSAVITNSGKVPVNAAKQSFPRAATSTSTARYVNTAASRPKVNDALPTTYSYFKAHSPVRRPFNQKSAAKTNNSNEKINTARFNNVTTAGPKAVVSAAEGNRDNTGNPQYALQDQGIFDSGCSRHMTGNKFYLSDYQDIDGGFVAFRGSAKGGKITGKDKIRTRKLDFKDVYFVKELKFNIFFVSQMCDKKNSVIFTETECLLLSPNFKLLDEIQVLLKIPRQNNMYSFDLKNVVPSGDLFICKGYNR